jgi:hypothetical protein
MKIEVYQPPEPGAPTKGSLCLWYGKSGVGKTATLLQTARDPIFYLMAEGRSIDSTVKAIKRENLRMKIGYYSNWDDLLGTMFLLANFYKIQSIIIDSMTHLMSILLPDEILKENFDARERKNGQETLKDLTTRVKGTPEMYGALSNQMKRLMTASQQLCLAGHDVHFTARDQDNPKWNLELACGPALAGKEFGKDMKGFFDFIGMLTSQYSPSGQVIYPPFVSCDDNGAYLSKWTGCKPDGGVINQNFHVERMLNYARTGIAA